MYRLVLPLCEGARVGKSLLTTTSSDLIHNRVCGVLQAPDEGGCHDHSRSDFWTAGHDQRFGAATPLGRRAVTEGALLLD